MEYNSIAFVVDIFDTDLALALALAHPSHGCILPVRSSGKKQALRVEQLHQYVHKYQKDKKGHKQSTRHLWTYW